MDKISADAFVDAYAGINYNFPKPQAPALSLTGASLGGGNGFRQFDVANGFSLNWVGVNASYAADPIGGTVSLRMGPGATIYNGPLTVTSDDAYGLQFVKQAYATWKPAGKLTLDFGKWDQPYGSEVADSQLNINYTRSFLFTFAQPLFFTGLRIDYAASDAFDLKVFAANGWNNTIDNNAGKTFGAQIMLKPADSLVLYLGDVFGPEQTDVTTAATGTGATPGLADVPNSPNSNFRNLVDFVADFNPTSSLRFLLNGDYGTESGVADAMGTHSALWYGANLAIKYAFSDAFYGTLRGEYFHDDKGDRLGVGVGTTTTNLESGVLTLAYSTGSHLAFMLDNRLDVADNPIFQVNTNGTPSKTQFTTTLGIIASTK